MAKYHKLKVKEITQETADTITVHLKQPLFSKIKYISGQFLTILVPIDGKTERRAYSLCSAPVADSDLMFTVKRVPKGLVSNYLNDNLNVGDKLEIMEPLGNFIWQAEPKIERHVVLFGAGSGITPLMSILKTVLLFEPKSKVTLVYGNQTESSIIFKNKLDWFQDKYGERLKITHVLSQKPVDWAITGRINTQIVEKTFENINKSNAICFLCGPEGMQTTVRETLEKLGLTAQQIQQESFVNTKLAVSPSESDSSDSKTVTIMLDGASHEIDVPSDKFILDAGLEAGLDMPFSCQSGICTACRGKCQTGEVKMQDDEGLSESEIRDGYVLTCVSRPMTDDVVIEIG